MRAVMNLLQVTGVPGLKPLAALLFDAISLAGLAGLCHTSLI